MRAKSLYTSCVIASAAILATEVHAQSYTFTVLNGLDGTADSSYTSAFGVNNLGQVVGVEELNGSAIPIIWNSSTLIALTLPQGATSGSALSINDAGQVAGTAHFPDGKSVAVVWQGSTMTELSGPPGEDSTGAEAVNSAGQVLGESRPTASPSAAPWTSLLIWEPGQAVPVVVNTNQPITLTASECSLFPTACLRNSVGQFLDGDGSTGQVALFSPTAAGYSVSDLNSLLPPDAVAAGWFVTSAGGVNDKGWISGDAENLLTGLSRSFLLTPNIPEPSTLAMFALGLCGIGYVARRIRPAN